MAQIRPFYALAPSPGNAAVVSSLPNDVITEEEAREITAANPLSFIKIVRPETMFPVGTNPYSDEVYSKAASLLSEWKNSGILEKDNDRAFYLYRLIRNGHSQTGLVALSSVDDYLNGICKQHEHTVTEKEDDRVRHINACHAQTGPIFLTYRPITELKKLFAAIQEDAPLFDFTADYGICHTVWKVSDPLLCRQITELFEQVPYTYIADGHHRSAAAVRTAVEMRKLNPGYTGEEEFNWFLSVLFPSDELEILSCNRVVLDHNGLSDEDLLNQLKANYNVTPLQEMCEPQARGSAHMYMSSKWYCITIKEEVLNERKSTVDRLDVSMLQELVLSPILGIKDPRTDRRIEFVGGIKGISALKETADRYDGAIAFAMYPTCIDDLMDIADSGEVMPPKSTWFEPKLRSGLFIHEI